MNSHSFYYSPKVIVILLKIEFLSEKLSDRLMDGFGERSQHNRAIEVTFRAVHPPFRAVAPSFRAVDAHYRALALIYRTIASFYRTIERRPTVFSSPKPHFYFKHKKAARYFIWQPGNNSLDSFV